MFPKYRALLAAPRSDSEEQWVGLSANCDLLQCTIPWLGGRHWDVCAGNEAQVCCGVSALWGDAPSLALYCQ